MLKKIGETCSLVYLIEAKHFRAMKIDVLKSNASINQANLLVKAQGDVKTTIQFVL
jgi:hypothetical protein